MLIIMISFGALIFNSGLSSITTEEPSVDYREIGKDFLTYYWPALVVMALVLSSSITGAMVLARRHDGVEDEQRTDWFCNCFCCPFGNWYLWFISKAKFHSNAICG